MDCHRQALAIFRELGDRSGEAETLNGAGETLHAAGRPEQARAQHGDALTLAGQIGDRYQQARAHNGLAHTLHTTGDLEQARYHWQQALTLYTGLGVPDADQIRASLQELDATLHTHDRSGSAAARPAFPAG